MFPEDTQILQNTLVLKYKQVNQRRKATKERGEEEIESSGRQGALPEQVELSLLTLNPRERILEREKRSPKLDRYSV